MPACCRRSNIGHAKLQTTEFTNGIQTLSKVHKPTNIERRRRPATLPTLSKMSKFRSNICWANIYLTRRTSRQAASSRCYSSCARSRSTVRTLSERRQTYIQMNHILHNICFGKHSVLCFECNAHGWRMLRKCLKI